MSCRCLVEPVGLIDRENPGRRFPARAEHVRADTGHVTIDHIIVPIDAFDVKREALSILFRRAGAQRLEIVIREPARQVCIR